MGCGVQVDSGEDSAGHWPGPDVEDLVEDAGGAPCGERGNCCLLKLRGRVGAEFERAARGSARRCAETGDDTDGVFEQVTHGPFLARGLVVVLVGADAADDPVRLLERLLE